MWKLKQQKLATCYCVFLKVMLVDKCFVDLLHPAPSFQMSVQCAMQLPLKSNMTRLGVAFIKWDATVHGPWSRGQVPQMLTSQLLPSSATYWKIYRVSNTSGCGCFEVWVCRARALVIRQGKVGISWSLEFYPDRKSYLVAGWPVLVVGGIGSGAMCTN